MAKTIYEGFCNFNDNLKICATETATVSSHRSSIQQCLENNFDMRAFFKTGSIGNGTNISGYSDTDYFSVIPAEKLSTDSSYVLQKLKSILENRFSTTVGIRVNTPAVVIPFGTNKSETTEIVPSYYIETKDGKNIYGIPNSSGGWTKASPKTHNEFVTSQNIRLDKKVKPLVRFIKAWKYYQNVPITSFYLEMFVAKFASKEESIAYSVDVRNVLKQLWDNQLSLLVDPTGVSGYISPCTTEAKKEEALSKLNTALTRANKAREEEKDDNISESFYWWNLLFNDKFSKYN